MTHVDLWSVLARAETVGLVGLFVLPSGYGKLDLFVTR